MQQADRADNFKKGFRGLMVDLLPFQGIHKLWEIVTSFKRANQSVKVTLTEFATAIERFCTSSWTTVSLLHHRKPFLTRL